VATKDKYRNAHPNKYKATNAVNNALAAGNLVKPSSCSRCGRSVEDLEQQGLRLEAHHHSYAKEDWLNVHFYCNTCHAQEHIQIEQDGANEEAPKKNGVSLKRYKENPSPQMFLNAAKIWAEMQDGLHGDHEEWDKPVAGSKQRERWALEVRSQIPGLTSPNPVSHQQILLEIGYPEDKKMPEKPPAWMLTPEFLSVVQQHRKYQAALRLPESFKVASFLRPVANEIAMLLFTRIKQTQLGIGKPIPDSVLFGDGWKIMRTLAEKDGEIQQAGVNINIQNFDLLPADARKEALARYFAQAERQALEQLESAEEEILEGEIEE